MLRWLKYRDIQSNRRQKSEERAKRRARFARQWSSIQEVLDRLPDCYEKQDFLGTMKRMPPNCSLSWMAANRWVRQIAVLKTWQRIESSLENLCESAKGGK